MGRNQRLMGLVEIDSSHESGLRGISGAKSTAKAYADSAAGAVSGPDRAPPFRSETIGIKSDPEMRHYALFNGARVALFTPTGEHLPWLSRGLSLLESAVCQATARKYVHALTRLLDVGSAGPDFYAALVTSRDAARTALSRLLAASGCRMRYHQLPAGAVLVTPPDELVRSVDVALTALGHCYTQHRIRGEIDFDPIACPEARLTALPDADHQRPMRYFVITNRRHSRPLTADPHCAELLRTLDHDWPAGIRAAAEFTADHGQRISETLSLTIADWAASGFGDRVLCPNKGSRGARTKTLYLTPAWEARLAEWVDGPRRALTDLGLDELKRIHRQNPGAAPLHAALFLNTCGRRISYPLFNDHYWRPALRVAGSAATPHWLRHELTSDRLIAIRALAADPGDEARMVRLLADMQGWLAGAAMVHYYAGDLADSDQRALLRQLAEAPPPAAVPRPASDASAPEIAALAAFAAGEVR